MSSWVGLTRVSAIMLLFGLSWSWTQYDISIIQLQHAQKTEQTINKMELLEEKSLNELLKIYHGASFHYDTIQGYHQQTQAYNLELGRYASVQTYHQLQDRIAAQADALDAFTSGFSILKNAQLYLSHTVKTSTENFSQNRLFLEVLNREVMAYLRYPDIDLENSILDRMTHLDDATLIRHLRYILQKNTEVRIALKQFEHAQISRIRTKIDMQSQLEQSLTNNQTYQYFFLIIALLLLTYVFWELWLKIQQQNKKIMARNLSYDAFQHLLDGILTLDQDGYVVTVNPALENLFGYPPKYLTNKNIEVLIPIKHRKTYKRLLSRMTSQYSRHTAQNSLELCGLHQQGHLIPLEVSIKRFKQGGQFRVSVLLRDISLRKKTEDKMRKLNHEMAEAKAASRAKGDFLAVMSHELRTPLHGIIGLQSLLIKEANYLTPEHRSHLDLALHSSNMLHALIDDILDLSKIEADKMEITRSEFDVVKLLHACTTAFYMSAQEKNLCLTLTCHELPRKIYADKAHIRQVLLNLMGNALKFTDHGWVKVAATFKKDHLIISISDSGIGIAKDHLKKLFEPFVQLSNSASRKGTGLGTTIAKRLIIAMDGDIHVDSVVGQGSHFQIRIPIKIILDQRITKEIDVSSVPKDNFVHKVENIKSIRVLLAEDDDISRMIALKKMRKSGLQVDVAMDGKEAWEKIQKHQYDVLLTDLRMPHMDGTELTRNVRQLEKNNQHRTRIIGLSAHAMQDVAQACLDAGMDDFISKPLNLDTLLQKII